MGEIRINPGSKLVGSSLRDAHLRDRNILVLGLRDPQTGQFRYAPDSNTVLAADMTLIVLGEEEEIKKGA